MGMKYQGKKIIVIVIIIMCYDAVRWLQRTMVKPHNICDACEYI